MQQSSTASAEVDYKFRDLQENLFRRHRDECVFVLRSVDLYHPRKLDTDVCTFLCSYMQRELKALAAFATTEISAILFTTVKRSALNEQTLALVRVSIWLTLVLSLFAVSKTDRKWRQSTTRAPAVWALRLSRALPSRHRAFRMLRPGRLRKPAVRAI